MKNKLKKTVQMLLCVVFSMCLLCGCGDDESKNDNESANTLDNKQCSKEEYVARITAYKEYYEDIETDYDSVNGAVLVSENGTPYVVLCYVQEEDYENYYKVQLIDYEKGKAVINGEKELFFDHQVEIQLAFIDDRCIFKAENSEASIEEYWEFEQGNLVAEKLDEKEAEEFEVEINGLGYVYDIAEEPCEYLYTIKKGDYRFVPGLDEYRYQKQAYLIYDEKSDKTSVNKVASKKLYDYMQLTDEQKEYFQYPKTNNEGEEILISDVVNIRYFRAKYDISSIFWINGVAFRQCLSELIEEPLYKIEDLLIKEISSSEDFIESKNSVENRKKEALNQIESLIPKYNPYSSDEELLELYYSYVKNTLNDWDAHENCYKCENMDLATIMNMNNEFANVFKTYFKEDYIFTSDKFKGATWKDIVYNGGTAYPTLTLSKNGNTLTVPIISDPIMKEAVDAYLAYGCANWFSIDFVYIDEDDVPELLQRYMDTQWEVYTYKNGTVTHLECDGFNSWEWYFKDYKPKGNKMILEGYDGNGNLISVEAHIQGNKIVRSLNSNNAQNNNENPEVKKALEEYARVFDAFVAESGDYYSFNGVALAYMDEDDIPEMIINAEYYGFHNYSASEMYTYKNGELRTFLGVDYIKGYIPKTGKYKGDVFYEEYDEDGASWLEGKEVICSMDGSAVDSIPDQMFENFDYHNDFTSAVQKMFGGA